MGLEIIHLKRENINWKDQNHTITICIIQFVEFYDVFGAEADEAGEEGEDEEDEEEEEWKVSKKKAVKTAKGWYDTLGPFAGMYEMAPPTAVIRSNKSMTFCGVFDWFYDWNTIKANDELW